MKYVIMCGGSQKGFDTPRHLTKIAGEPLLDRTIRLLQANGVKDIAVSSDNEQILEYARKIPGIEIIARAESEGSWISTAFPIFTNTPVCYLFGDVVFSPKAINTIVKTQTLGIEFFASAPPFDKSNYPKRWAEPFAFKVVDNVHFLRARQDVINLWNCYDVFKREPIAWELWQVIKKTPINIIDYTNYTVINDYTCDIDSPEDIKWWKLHGLSD